MYLVDATIVPVRRVQGRRLTGESPYQKEHIGPERLDRLLGRQDTKLVSLRVGHHDPGLCTALTDHRPGRPQSL